MRFLALLMTAALPSGVWAQVGNTDTNSVNRACGRVTFTETVGTQWSYFHSTPRAIPDTPVFLYRRASHEKCCTVEATVSKTVTGVNGQFEFKGAAPGQYWFVVLVGKKKYKLPITLTSAVANTDCSKLTYEVDRDRGMRIVTIVTMYEFE